MPSLFLCDASEFLICIYQCPPNRASLSSLSLPSLKKLAIFEVFSSLGAELMVYLPSPSPGLPPTSCCILCYFLSLIV